MADSDTHQQEPNVRVYYYRSVEAVLREARTGLSAADFAALMAMVGEEHGSRKDVIPFVRDRLLAVARGDVTPTPVQMEALTLLLRSNLLTEGSR